VRTAGKNGRDVLNLWRGDDEGWFWRRGFDAGFEGRDVASDLAAISPEDMKRRP
jgi:hypothetical protein